MKRKDIDVGKCTQEALDLVGKDNAWLAKESGLDHTRVCHILNSKNANSATLNYLAWAFKMKVSEFIALGE